MRVVNTPLSKDKLKLVKEVAEKSKLKDHVDIVEDIYSFMEKPQIIDANDIREDLIKDFAQGKFEYYLPAKRKIQGRIDFFNRILNHPYYAKFKTLDTNTSSQVLLDMLNAFYKAKQKQEKQSGGTEKKDEAMKEFEDIIKYGRELFDLLDDEWFQQLMQQQQAGGEGGKEGNPKDGEKTVKKIVEQMAHELLIYELSKKLEFTIRVSKKGKFNEVHYPDNGLDVNRIEKIRDITKLLPAQLALDDDVFLKKLVSKELLKKKYLQRQEKRQVLYMLVDSSGSMSSNVTPNLTNIDVCKAVAIALMKKMIDNEDMFFFRWFTDRVDELHTITTKKEALAFLPKLVYGRGADGGTRIQNAISVAVNDINKKIGKKIDEADILLVSDGEDTVDIPETNKMLGKIDMHTVLITPQKYNRTNPIHNNMVQISKNLLVTACKEGSDIVDIANVFSK